MHEDQIDKAQIEIRDDDWSEHLLVWFGVPVC